MPIYSNHYTVGASSVVQIVAPDVEPQVVYIHDDEHSQSRKLFIGNAEVSASTGLHVQSTETKVVNVPPNDGIWAISDGGNVNVHVMRVTQH